ncbi:glycosyltransferase [Halotia branconii]|uniref:Glycosyltransferase n=1 Tax=Halotia branconii CENA392 TaxID=1539056 RepID=A0AAJ6NZ04_9CYAN|nr:glycosyltransferase [Halotia branconii]WGV28998.1 glycosyltransferase [Halotia branconii CENA392]
MLKTLNYRIIHLSKYYPPDRGGIETHVQTLARSQAALGAEVHVICVNAFDQHGHFSNRTQTVNETDCNVQVTRLGRFLSFARFDFCPKVLSNLCRLLNEPNTLLHLHTPNPTMLLALTLLPRRLPLVITHHSDIIKQRILKYVLRPFEYLVYSQTSRVLTTSSQYIQGSKLLRLYRHKLSILPLGIDFLNYIELNQLAVDFSQYLKAKYGETIWLVVGRLVYYKALHIAIEALTLVPGTLIIIGTGPLEQELKALAKKLGVNDRIVWLGHVSEDELIGAYQAATSLWFPSNVRSEGFGLVQVEAMASGCPVINADIPCSGVPWVSRHEQEGLTVPINDSIALASAAKRLLYEPGLRTKLVIASRKRSEYFNQETMAQRSFELYEEVLSQESNYIGIAKPVNL